MKELRSTRIVQAPAWGFSRSRSTLQSESPKVLSEGVFSLVPALFWKAQAKFSETHAPAENKLQVFQDWLQSRVAPDTPIPPKAFETWLKGENRINEYRPFQQEGMVALSKGANVLVSAHTGSGKTLIGEYAIRSAVRDGKKAFYTTPRKALCNDKYWELIQHFGKENVGLMTGDYTDNPKAPIIIMTTEVLRDMLHNYKNNRGDKNILNGVGVWVDDEVHSLGAEKDRGVVWEESIMLLPDHIQQVHLSATMGNAEKFNEWLNFLIPDSSRLVQSLERPVPLHRYFYSPRGKLVPIYKTDQTLTDSFKKEFPMSWSPEYFTNSGKQFANQRPEARMVSLIRQLSVMEKDLIKKNEDLKTKSFLPLIAFFFSRVACNTGAIAYYNYLKYAENNGDFQYTLLNSEEKKKASEMIQAQIQKFPWLAQITITTPESSVLFVDLLKNGIGVHHAGMLPAQKQLVEDLLKAGLLKATFSTSTLALGINVPIKTTVISSYEVQGEPISQSDIQQMMGRAGRPGMYPLGFSIFFDPGDMEREMFLDFMNAPPADVHSQIYINPKMVLNFLKNYQSTSFQNFVERSFASFCTPEKGKKLAQQFEMLLPYLQRHGFLSETGVLTDLGKLAATMPSDYDLLLSQAIASGKLDDLTPAQLAAVLSTTMGDETPKKQMFGTPNHPDEELTIRICKALDDMLDKLVKDNPDDEIVIAPKALNTVLALTVQRWCETGDWKLVLNPPNDAYPGDVFSAIRRTSNLMEVLAKTSSQWVSSRLKQNAQAAYELLRREEVNQQIIP